VSLNPGWVLDPTAAQARAPDAFSVDPRVSSLRESDTPSAPSGSGICRAGSSVLAMAACPLAIVAGTIDARFDFSRPAVRTPTGRRFVKGDSDAVTGRTGVRRRSWLHESKVDALGVSHLCSAARWSFVKPDPYPGEQRQRGLEFS